MACGAVPALLLLGLWASPAVAGEVPRLLVAGERVEGVLSGGEAYTYRVDVEPVAPPQAPSRQSLDPRAPYLRIVLDQRGIDLVLELADAAGEAVLTLDSPTGHSGEEGLTVPAVGPHYVTVRAARGAGSGGYRLSVEEILPATAADEQRLQAELAATRGAHLFHQGTEAARRRALELFAGALDAFQRLDDRRREAQLLHFMGATHHRLGELEGALERLEAALVAWKRVAAAPADAGRTLESSTPAGRTLTGTTPDGRSPAGSTVTSTTQDDMTQGDTTPGDRTLTGTALDSAALRGTTLNEMGFVLWRLGRGEEARERYAQAMEAFRAAGDGLGEAKVLNNLGLAHLSAGEPEAAGRAYRKALGLLAGASAGSFEALLLDGLGGAHQLLGEHRRALECFHRALAIYRSLDRSPEAARVLSNLGVSHRALGELEEALAVYLEVLHLRRREGDRRGEATVLNNIGLLYLALGEADRARIHLEEALALHEEAGSRRGEAATRNNLGQCLRELGDGARALEHYRRAQALRRQLGDRRGEAITLDHLGALHADAGDLDAAEAAFREALDLRRAVGDPSKEAKTLRNLGWLYLGRGEAERALEPLAQALALHRSVGDRVGEADTLHALARAEHGLGRLEEARGHLEASLAITESLRGRVGAAELRASFFARRRQVHTAYVEVLMALHRRHPDRGLDLQALEASERGRARSLLDLLTSAGRPIDRGLSPELRRRRGELEERLRRAAARRARLGAKATYGGAADGGAGNGGAEAGEAIQAAEREIEGLLTELEALEAESRRQSPGYAALTQPRILTAPEIQELLDGETLLLEYALGEERSYLWAVTPEEVRSFELPGRDELETAARGLYEMWSTLDVRGAAAEGRAAAALGRRLLGPVAPLLTRRRIVVVADGALHVLPFAALPRPDGGGEALVARHEIVSLPSASVLAVERRALAGRAPAPRAVAVLADPIFSPLDPRLQGAGAAAGAGASTEASTEAAPTSPTGSEGERAPPPPGQAPFPRLPATRREAEVLAGLVPEGEIRQALGAEASRALVAGGELAGYRIVHLATHGVLDTRRPALSGLVLSLVDGEGRPVDGFLRLGDIYNLELHADLLVLSGCQTALGREIRGEGLVGLTRGFMHAGAAAVVASLWRVQDRATAELMARFYRALLVEGRPAAAALRAAQLGMLAETRWRDPYYWAVFLYQGDWR